MTETIPPYKPKRDPRQDPQPGDVTMNRNGSKFTIVTRTDSTVIYYMMETPNGRDERGTLSLEDWREWAKYDSVIKP